MKIEDFIKKTEDSIKRDKARLKSEQTKNSVLHEIRQGFQLKLENKLDTNIRIWGYIIGLYTIFGFIASTCLSIYGGLQEVPKEKITAFVLATIFIQSGIILFSLNESKIRMTKHFTGIKLLQWSLIILSIYFNWNFFGKHNFWILLQCVIIELTVIKSCSIGGDFRSLTFRRKLDMSNNVRPSIFKILFSNLVFKFWNNQVRLYNDNMKTANQVMIDSPTLLDQNLDKVEPKLLEVGQNLDRNLEKVKPKLDIDKEVGQKLDYDEVKKMILDKYQDNECITNFPINLRPFRQKLKDENIIYCQGNKTYKSPEKLKVIEN